MRRLKSDRGAVGVMVAILIPALLACTALVVDVGALYLRRSELQNAADAAALAIAQDCGGPNGCLNPSMTASSLVKDNAGSSASVEGLDITDPFVTVTAKSTVLFSFAPLIGNGPKNDSNDVTARAIARWAPPIGGRAALPITFSWCAFLKQTNGGLPSPTSTSIRFSKEDGTNCTGPSGNSVPGGFGWVVTDAGRNCSTTSTGVVGAAANILYSDTGSSKKCSDLYFTALLGQTVLLPLFNKAGGSGSGAWYQVYAYAAFRLTGFHFQGSHNWIEGYFLKFAGPTEEFTYGPGAHDVGARVVTLTG